MEAGVMTTQEDPLLAALASARKRKEQANRDIRLLLAYARELSMPRPYRLADLADAAGLSISGVRTAYTQADIEHAARLTRGTRSRHLLAVITTLLINRQDPPAHERHPAA
jgi:AraC-like DNA-binding protein